MSYFSKPSFKLRFWRCASTFFWSQRLQLNSVPYFLLSALSRPCLVLVWKMVLNFFKSLGLGELPASYNKAIHGPYDPARFYGKSKYSRQG